MEVIDIDDFRQLKEIATFKLYEDYRGCFSLVVVDADKDFIDSHTTLSERFEALHEMCILGTVFLSAQAKEWKEKEDKVSVA
jgi:hypothetical protein